MSFRLGRIFGFPVEVDWTWFVIFALVVWAIKGALTRFVAPGSSDWLLVAIGVVGALLFFASLIGHELAHSYVARKQGIPIAGITLFVFGGVARMKSEPGSPQDELKMALAGPLFSLVAAAFFWLVWGAQFLPQVWNQLFFYLAAANLVVALFNLVPAFPTDGGRALRAVVWAWTGNLQAATRVAAGFGQAFGWLLVFYGVFLILMRQWGGIWYALIGLFLQNAAQSAVQQAHWQRAMSGLLVRDLMNRNPVALSPEATVDEAVHDYFLREPVEALPVAQDGQVLGVLNVSDLREVDRAEWGVRTVGQIMNPIPERCYVAPDADAWEALTSAGEGCESPLIVVEDGKLVGTLTQETLARQIRLRMQIKS